MLLDSRVLSYQTAFSTTLTASPSAQLIVADSGEITGGGIPAFPVLAQRTVGDLGVIIPVLSLTVGGGEITLANPGGGTSLIFTGDNSILFEDRLDNLHDFTEVALEFTDASGVTADDFAVSADEVVIDLTDVTLDSGETILVSVGFADNSAPVVTSDAAPTVVENEAAVLVLAASDADGDAVTFSITGGADAALFEIIDGDQLTFVAAPDFEAPGSDGGGNLYQVEVTADDGWDGQAVQSIEVTVTDENERPMATGDGAETARTPEDSPTGNLVPSLLANDEDPDGDDLRIVAVDSSATEGTVSFDEATQTLIYDPNGAFDLLREGQSATDRFTYTISDGEFTATATALVTIDGVDVGPVEIVGTAGNDTLIDPAHVANLIWGDARDALTGRGGNDRIFGRGGDDEISGDATTIAASGRGGADRILGGDGDDRLYGDATGTLHGRGGNDLLLQGAGTGLLVGDALDMAGGAKGGNDRLVGTGGGRDATNEITPFAVRPPEAGLYGDAATTMAGNAVGGNDTLDASAGSTASLLFGDARELLEATRGGNDLLRGGSAADILTGDAATLSGTARGGRDTLWGNGGDDRLFGDGEFLTGSARAGNDILRGGAGVDLLFGDGAELAGDAVGGGDQLHGGTGDDTLWGDGLLLDGAVGGKDRFYFSGGFGDDVIQDFRSGEDRIVFTGLTRGEVQITREGSDTVLTTLGDDSVTLVDYVGPLSLATDVIFA